MEDPPPARRERVGDQAPVAADPPGLGAHDRDALFAGERLELGEAGGELIARHVVGVAAELVALPGAVRRVRQGFAPPAQALAEPAVADAGLEEDRGEGGSLEMGLATRARIAPDVGDQLDAGAAQQLDELLLVVVRMPDREDLASGRHPPILLRLAGSGG